MNNFGRDKLLGWANQAFLISVVYFSLAGCTKHEQAEPFDITDRLQGLWARDGHRYGPWAKKAPSCIRRTAVSTGSTKERSSNATVFHLRERLAAVDCRGGWCHPALDGRRQSLAAAKERDESPIVFSLRHRFTGLGGR